MNKGLFVVALLAILVVPCAKKESSSHTKTIGVTLLTRAHILCKDLEEGLQEGAAKNQYEVPAA